MKITKSYQHLYQADLPAADATVEAAPSSTEPPQFSQMDESPTPPASEPRKSNLPKIVIIGLAILIIFLIYKLIPRSYEDCTSLPGSNVSGDTCTTFFRRSFIKGGVQMPPSTAAADKSGTYPQYTFPSTTPKAVADATDANEVPTTKGGLPLPTSTTAPKKAAAPTATAPMVTSTPQNPVPTSSPSDTSIPNDWVKHRYPDQQIAFWLPPGWSGSNAVYYTDTGITNFYLGGTDSIKVTIMPDWSATNGANSQPTNYQVGGIAAIKVVGNTYTTVYFERAGEVYQFICQNSLWSTCHTILQNIDWLD